MNISKRFRQKGGETVEFALLSTLIFLLMFAMIEFFIAVYNQGVITHASRIGARQASMYWVDVTKILPNSDPKNDQKISISEVQKITNSFTNQFTVFLEQKNLEIKWNDSSISNNQPVQHGQKISVNLTGKYKASVTKALIKILDIDMGSASEMRIE